MLGSVECIAIFRANTGADAATWGAETRRNPCKLALHVWQTRRGGKQPRVGSFLTIAYHGQAGQAAVSKTGSPQQ